MKFNFEATGIGSVPFKDPKTACRIILDNFQKIPFWPQLPKRSYLENMYVQFAERLPGLVCDEEKKTIYIDTSKAGAEIEKVYEKYLACDLDFFAISEDRAKGLYRFLEELKNLPGGARLLKGQTTGPISYALFLTDQNKRAVIYDRDLFEVLTKTLSMRARWQIRQLKKFSSDVIIFIDEPYLVSIGSSFVNIDAGCAFEKFDEVASAIKDEGAVVGVHCCGNTDWSLVLKRNIDILNFDAYNFTKEFLLYADDIKTFLGRGGTIAWGLVPSSEAVEKETPESLAGRLDSALTAFGKKGIVTKGASALVTSSCGSGAMDEQGSRKVLEMTRILSDRLQKQVRL